MYGILPKLNLRLAPNAVKNRQKSFSTQKEALCLIECFQHFPFIDPQLTHSFLTVF